MSLAFKTKFVASFALCLALLGLSSCRDSEQSEEDRAALFTTSTKPKPNPKKESLEALVREDKSDQEQRDGLPLFPLYSEYEGEDMHQLTGVSGRSLLLCFSAPWCPYSEKMQGALQELADLEKGKLQVVNINADEYPEIAKSFKIKKVPSCFLYVEGVKLRHIEGSYTAQSLQRYLQKTISTHSVD